MTDTEPKIAVVTGANRGIGLACVTALRDAGYTAVGTYRTTHPDVEGVSWVQCDVTDDQSVIDAFNKIDADHGPAVIVVSNAGITNDGLALQMETDEFVGVLDANLVGTFRVARQALQRMTRARWGRLIFMGSVSGRAGQPGQANYAASKAGMIGLARTLGKEYARRNVTVNVVAPGPVDTEILDDVTDEMKAAMKSAIPLNRIGTVDEVASAVLWLASDGAGFTTGAVLPVDGGMFMSA